MNQESNYTCCLRTLLNGITSALRAIVDTQALYTNQFLHRF